MITIRHNLNETNYENAWVTIGSFDGVHLGHQSIIRPMVAEAHRNQAPAVIITFYPHPSRVLRQANGPFYLSSPAEQAEIFDSLGVDLMISAPFTVEFASLTADEFVQQLKDHLGIASLWVGQDFALGKARMGNIEYLEKLGNTLGFRVNTVPPCLIQGEIVSSSKIRSLLQAGEVQKAAQFLGRPYRFSGTVIRGDGRGRGLGFPTANIEIPDDRLVPRIGVYVTRAGFNGRWFPAVTNIGYRPTFEKESVIPWVEAHILDFDQDLYDQTLQLDFCEFLRPEKRFSSVDELIGQIHNDIQRTKEVLAHAS